MSKVLENLIGRPSSTRAWDIPPMHIKRRVELLEKAEQKGARVLVQLRPRSFIQDVIDHSPEVVAALSGYFKQMGYDLHPHKPRPGEEPKTPVLDADPSFKWCAPAGRTYKKGIKKYVIDQDFRHTFKDGEPVSLSLRDAQIVLRAEPIGLGFLLEEVDPDQPETPEAKAEAEEKADFEIAWRERKAREAKAKAPKTKHHKQPKTPGG